MSDYPPMAVRSIRGVPLLDCPHVRISENMRLWYLPHEPATSEGRASGFDFWCGQFAAGPCVMERGKETAASAHDPADYLSHPATEAEAIFHGVAYHDGVRHLYMGDASDGSLGYVCYPHLNEMAAALLALQGVERVLCPHAD